MIIKITSDNKVSSEIIISCSDSFSELEIIGIRKFFCLLFLEIHYIHGEQTARNRSGQVTREAHQLTLFDTNLLKSSFLDTWIMCW